MVEDTIFHLPPTSILISYYNLTAMAARRPQPMFRKLPEPIIPADRVFPSSEALVLSPTSPLERNLRSPKGWKNRNSDGIGLGIVAALEKSGSIAGAPSKLAVASAPIVIASPRTVGYRAGSREEPEAGCIWRCVAVGPDKNCGDVRRKETRFFCGSPPPVYEETAVFRPADFLSHCYLCSKRLFGKDIYMYRGEKAFCSMECRYRQIVSDEFQEKCGREASKPSTDVSSSPYSGGDRLFFTGIVAA